MSPIKRVRSLPNRTRLVDAEELAPGGGQRRDHNRGGSYVDGKGEGTDKKLVDCRCAAEKDERDQDDAKKRGGQSPARHLGILIMGVMRGEDDADIRNFNQREYYPVLRLSLILLKCISSRLGKKSIASSDMSCRWQR
jgi:hypothetical protein